MSQPDPTLTSAPPHVGTAAFADTALSTANAPLLTGNSERYRLGAEIARGGMGVVHRATDVILSREVAAKILQDRFALGSDGAQRFTDEARISAQLQHPGIPPVHDLGTLPDGRPFLAMKLIKGETLDDLLMARTSPAEDRGRFVAAFEQVCQAVAYAHAHDVIHRDLKPANVMVGAFGEVQVMDWGLAKVLTDAGPDADDPDATSPGTLVQSFRDSDGSFTQAGSVLGTPAYMPPEQAVGAVGKIDARSDVFGLGAVLAVILTGQPPFAGSSAETTRVKAATGDLADCISRMDACEADPELVALCKRCLAPKPADRPADAGAVAREVAALRTAADERARQAELDKVKAEGDVAAAKAQAAQRRKRRRVQAFLAGVIALAVVAGLAVVWWADRERERAAAADRRRVEGAVLSAAESLDDFRFAHAGKALAAAADQLPANAPADLRQALTDARSDLALVRELDDIRFERIRGNPTGASERMTAAYRAVFARLGMDPSPPEPAVAEWVAGSRVKRFLVTAIDSWARYKPDPDAQARLAAVASAADPSPASDELRKPSMWADPAARAKLPEKVDLNALPVNLLVLYFQVRDESWLGAEAEHARAANRFPNDFWVQFEAAFYHAFKQQNQAEAVPYLRAAVAIRPDHMYAFYMLARAESSRGRFAEAVDAARKVVALDPRYGERYQSRGGGRLARLQNQTLSATHVHWMVRRISSALVRHGDAPTTIADSKN